MALPSAIVPTKPRTGRPTRCTPELVEDAWDYVHGGWVLCGDAFPSVEGLCDELRLSRSMVYRWASDETHPFKDILSELMAKQGRVLLNNGTRGVFNAPVTKMVLTKHGYSDKIDQNHESRDGSMANKPNVINLVAPDVNDDGG